MTHDPHDYDYESTYEKPYGMLKYFWDEKGDYKRWTGYEEWAEKYKDLAQKLDVLLTLKKTSGRKH